MSEFIEVGQGVCINALPYETSRATGELRWVMDIDPTPRLQQRFLIVEYDGGVATNMREEWRDVPTEVQPSPGHRRTP